MTWNGIGFDLDNTLFSHEKAFETAIKESYDLYCTHVQISKVDAPFKNFFPIFKRNSDKYWHLFEEKKIDGTTYRRMRFNETMKALELPYSDHLSDRFHSHYYRIVDDHSVPFQGMAELMTLLEGHDIKVIIITNGTIDTQYGKVKKLGLDKWIHHENIIVSEEVGVAKPDREIFRLGEEKLSLSTEEILFVGDSWMHDIVGSIDAGWDAIFLNTRGEERKTEHAPLKECLTLEEVYHFLSRIYERRNTP